MIKVFVEGDWEKKGQAQPLSARADLGRADLDHSRADLIRTPAPRQPVRLCKTLTISDKAYFTI